MSGVGLRFCHDSRLIRLRGLLVDARAIALDLYAERSDDDGRVLRAIINHCNRSITCTTHIDRGVR